MTEMVVLSNAEDRRKLKAMIVEMTTLSVDIPQFLRIIIVRFCL